MNTLLAGSLLLPSHASADGMPAYVDQTGWHMLAERAQQAVVVMKDGQEHLYLQISLEDRAKVEQASRLVWLTPIPAEPAAVHVEILDQFPQFGGVAPGVYVASKLRLGLELIALSQLWTAPLVLLTLTVLSARIESDLVVHEKLVRNGMELQLLSAESIGALAAHLRKEQVELPQEAVASLATYLGPTRCFVLVRIVDLPAYRAATSASAHSPLGVAATFPSQEGYFPLVASSTLPGDQLDIVVTAPGFQRPSPPIPQGLTTRHYLGYQMVSVSSGRHAVASSDERLLYTRFTISGHPRTLQDDLRFHPEAPPLTTRMAMGWMISPHAKYAALLLGVVGFLALSVLASILARGAWPDSCRPSYRRAAWIGLANVFTILGVLVAAIKVARRENVSSRRAVRFAVAFSGIFCGLLVGLALMSRLV